MSGVTPITHFISHSPMRWGKYYSDLGNWRLGEMNPLVQDHTAKGLEEDLHETGQLLALGMASSLMTPFIPPHPQSVTPDTWKGSQEHSALRVGRLRLREGKGQPGGTGMQSQSWN